MYFDIAMPLTLFGVTMLSLFLNGKVEDKLHSTLEEREFGTKDVVLLVGLMAVMISLIAVVRQLSLILTVLFMFAYSMILFIFTYLFSKNHWYVAAIPPAVFVLLYVFLRETAAWTYVLSNVYGVIFAVLVTLYLSSLFTWKSTAIFGGLITVLDMILVLVTGTMIQAANTARSLSLPILVTVPRIPLVITENGLQPISLGLGDFFFAGLLSIQTFKKYGKKTGILSTAAMAVSFFIFEVLILYFRIEFFPGTLMIICGWLPFVVPKALKKPTQPQVAP